MATKKHPTVKTTEPDTPDLGALPTRTKPGQTEQLPVPSPDEGPSWQSGEAKPDRYGSADERMAAMLADREFYREHGSPRPPD